MQHKLMHLTNLEHPAVIFKMTINTNVIRPIMFVTRFLEVVKFYASGISVHLVYRIHGKRQFLIPPILNTR